MSPYPKPLLVLSFILLLLAAACAPQAQPSPVSSPAYTVTAEGTLQTVLPTLTETVTPSPSPSFTAVFTATWTVTPGPTNTVTPAAQFERSEIISVSGVEGGFLLTLRVPGVDADLNAEMAGRKFQCQYTAEAPDLLFCRGISRPPADQQLDLQFTDPASGAVLYSGLVVLSSLVIPTATPVGFASCADRGKNLFCEVECRIYDGNPCIVASCSDACGPYYSIHDCPEDRPNDGICDKDLELQMKIRYGLPH